ncbi:MAG: hypothetical protein FJ119_05055 [Deltaproteobacteria bacterium]|nr:hypothetical protein [Deltaproteobacteria bacterium]
MFARYAPVATAVVTYLVFGSLLCIQTPLWIPPDEELHVAYCQYIARNNAIPRPAISTTKEPVIMAFHPPLYYSVGSLFFNHASGCVKNIVRIHDGPGYALVSGGTEDRYFLSAVYRLRFFTLLSGVIIIVSAYAALRMLFPQTVLPAAVGAFFIAANPQLLHVATGISNEIPAAALTSLCLLMLLLYCRRASGPGGAVLIGCILGLSLLTKTSTVFLVPLGMLVIVFAHKRTFLRIIRDLTLVFGAAAGISGWWYALNWKTLSALQTSQPWFNRTTPISLEYLSEIASTTFISFFGYFGAHQIALPLPYLLLYALIIVFGMCGLINAVIRKEYSRHSLVPALVLITAFMGATAVFALLNYTYYAPQGKYLYTVIIAVAALVAGGCLSLFGNRQKKTAAVALISLMVTLCVLALFSVFLPAVQEPRLRRIASQSDFNCISKHITEEQPFTYVFKVAENNLCGIRILFSKTCATQTGALIFRLVQHDPAEKEVCRISLPLSDIRDSHWHYFGFPPIQDSAGQKFSIHCEAQGLEHEARLALWSDLQPAPDFNSNAADGNPIEGVPCFEAYAFTGTVPKTAWEGRGTSAIRQQLYVSVREMQLFNQFAPGSANKDIISRKWHRLEKAGNNRQKGCFETSVGPHR